MELAALERHYFESVISGWRYFQTSYAKDGTACVHCHRDHDDIKLWAGAYPKVEPFDGTPYEVKTLGKVVSEALEKHTDLDESGRSAMVPDIVSYIFFRGFGTFIRPGKSESFPPPSRDMELLSKSYLRGKASFPRTCGHCHENTFSHQVVGKKLMVEASTRFPHFVHKKNRVLSLESFLRSHSEDKGVSLSNSSVTDLCAYLRQEASGMAIHPGKL